MRQAGVLAWVALSGLAGPVLAQPVVTGNLNVSANVTCSGTASSCFCQQTGVSPRSVYQLRLTLSLPQRGQEPPFPLILFFHGYGGKYVLATGDYTVYSTAATAAGFAVLEYDIVGGGGWLETAIDAVELQFLPAVLQWAEGINARPETPATGRLDLSRLAVAGHSRGGKMAALHYTSGVRDFFAAYLIDPVDCPCFAPCTSNCFPSALDAVTAAGKALAVSGAQVKGCCNPRTGEACGFVCSTACRALSGNATCPGNDYQDFLLAAAGGSRAYAQAAGHMQFATLCPTKQVLANVACGYDSSVSSEDVCTEAAGNMVHWFLGQLPKPEPSELVL